MPQRFKSLLIALLLTATLPLLSGCNMVLFEPKGAIAAEQIRLIIIATILMLLIVVPVIVMTIVIAWRYRASNTKATYEPNWAHSVKLEVIWWGVPCIIVAILATLTWFTTHSLDPYKPLDSKVKPVTIQVIALDWKWVFVYPEQGIATINYIEIPENTPISFEITAQGPMNSFWIPQLGGQIYAMAGMRTRLHLIADTQGVYDGLSANYSGEGFAEMTFKVKVETPSDFAKWVETVKASPDALTTNVFNALIAPSSNIPVQYFSSVQPNLFNDEMMKFMMPPMTQMALSDETTLAVE
ncbi:MAG: ubiquinol oxidase subunit II [Gammaproteobacteria bacterium]|nr:ubiquinol oxidase subunit II [Gammaproteobacteria bacterium]